MNEQKKRFDSIDITDNFGIADVQTIEEDVLQDYLLNDPLPNQDDPTTNIKQVTKDPDSNPPLTIKELDKKEDSAPTDEVLKSFLTNTVDTPPLSTQDQEKKDPVKSLNASEDNEAASDDNIYATLNADLVKAGIFSENDEQPIVTDAKTFRERFLAEMNRGANVIVDQFLGQHGQDYREAFDAIFIKGVHPSVYYTIKEQIDDFENLDISKEENQEMVLRTFYKSKGFSSEKIAAKIQKIKDYGDLEEDAQQVHEVLLKEQQQRLDDEKQIAEQESYRREQNRVNYRNAVNGILQEKIKDKNIEGIPLSREVAQKIYNNLTQDAYKLPNNRIITAFEKQIMELDMPQNFEKKVKLALLMENDFDFSVIKKAAIKEESNNLFEGLERKKNKKQIPTVSQVPKYF